MKPYEITKKIQELETYYADCLGNNADYTQLDSIWKKIKSLQKQLLLSKIVEGFEIVSSANKLRTDPASASNAHSLRARVQSPGVPVNPESED